MVPEFSVFVGGGLVF